MKLFDGFRECAVGLQIRCSGVAAACVKPGLRGYRITGTWWEPAADRDELDSALMKLLQSLPAGLPVIPVSPGNLHFSIPGGPGELEEARPSLIWTPDQLLHWSGNRFRSGKNATQFYSALQPVQEINKMLGENGFLAPGCVAPAAAILGWLRFRSRTKDRNLLIVDDDLFRSHIVLFSNGSPVYTRTVLRNSDYLGPEIKVVQDQVRKLLPGFKVDRVTFLNRAPQDSDNFKLAFGAAVMFLEMGYGVCLGPIRDSGGRNTIWSPKRNKIAAVAALLLISLNLNFWIENQEIARLDPGRIDKPGLEELKNEVNRLKELTGSKDGSILPGRSAGSILAEIGRESQSLGTTIDAISGSIHGLNISGRSDRLQHISLLKEMLAMRFKDAVVEISSTEQKTDQAFHYTIRISVYEG